MNRMCLTAVSHWHPLGGSDLGGAEGDVSVEGPQETDEVKVIQTVAVGVHVAETQNRDKLRPDSSLLEGLPDCRLAQVLTFRNREEVINRPFIIMM